MGEKLADLLDCLPPVARGDRVSVPRETYERVRAAIAETALREPPEYEALLVRISAAEQLLRQCDDALTMAKIQLSQNDEGCILVDRALMALARFCGRERGTGDTYGEPPGRRALREIETLAHAFEPAWRHGVTRSEACMFCGKDERWHAPPGGRVRLTTGRRAEIIQSAHRKT